MKNATVLFSFAFLLSGCALFQSAKGGADTAKSTADDAKSNADSAQGQVKDAKAQAKGGDQASGGGGGSDAPDDDRLHAQVAAINTPIDDKVDFKKGDKVDWRKVTLLGKPGIATFELHWDEESSNLDLDVFDKFGTLIGKSPPKLEGQQVKKVLVEIPEAGQYYVRVSAPTKNDASIYTLNIKWKGPAAPPPAATASTTPPATATATATPPATATAPGTPGTPPAVDNTKVYAKILQMSRDGSTVTLYLDTKGVSAKLHAGMTGTVLEGDQGDNPADGGTFALAQVTSESRAIAKSTTLQKLGKNKRVLINLQ